MGNILRITLVCATLAFGGCATAQVSDAFASHFAMPWHDLLFRTAFALLLSDAFASHFDSARQDRSHGKCMSENAMFNNRQLMVAPNAVESAWAYCAKQSDVWYPGRADTRTTSIGWQGR